MKIWTNSLGKSFGGYSYYNSNKTIDSFLNEKKRIQNMKNSGFQFTGKTLNSFFQELENKYIQWEYHPINHHANLNDSIKRGNGKMVSVYGRSIEKFACTDGNIYHYQYYVNLLGEYKNVYVFTDKNKNILREFWH